MIFTCYSLPRIPFLITRFGLKLCTCFLTPLCLPSYVTDLLRCALCCDVDFSVIKVLSPPSKVSNFKKRVSPAKDIHDKRSKSSENKGSWKQRPDHLEALGTSIGSSGSLGAGLPDTLHPTVGLIPHMPSFGVMPDLSIDAPLAVFGTDDMDHGPLTSSTPASTPNRPLRRGLAPGSASTHESAVAGKKTSLDWSDDEIRLFEEGLVLYGSPNWRQVAAIIGTKTTGQVRQFSVKYFGRHGHNVVPQVDPARLEELRSQYLPSAGSYTPQSANSSGSLKQSGRLNKRSPPSGGSASGAGGKVTPKKAGLAVSTSGLMTPPGKTASSSLLSASASAGIGAPIGGIPSKGPGRNVSANRRSKADEQILVLKKNTGDEDEDICIEDEEIDVDGDDEDDDDGDHALIRAAATQDEDEEDEDEEDIVSVYDVDNEGSRSGSRSGSSGMDVHVAFSGKAPAHLSKAPASIAGSTTQWRQKPSFMLDQSGEYMREDSSTGYSDADSSVSGMDLSSSNASLYDPHASPSSAAAAHAASAVSIAQALKALGLEGEAWIEDVEIPPPKVLELAEDHVLDLEMQANSEFFEGNAVKTPERYVRIRNHIVRTWAMNKLRYITKTSVRRGLRDCGDVNAIGRVHQFLELVGAINFGLEAPPSCRKQGQPEPLSVLMMNKAPLQQHIQQQQLARAASSAFLQQRPPGVTSPMQPGAPSYASIAAGTGSSPVVPPTAVPLTSNSRPSIRSQFDPSFEVVKNSTHLLPTLIVSSNIMMVVDLHAQIHKRDGFGLIAGTWEPETNNVHLKHAIPYTGPQSSAASSLQAVAVWEKSVASWLENSSISKQAAAAGTPLEILGYYTTHKLNGVLSVTQFNYYRSVFCKGASRNRPFIGIFAVPFERTPDTTLFHSVMYPVSTPSAPIQPGAPQKTLCLLKRNVYCERKLPQEQFAQLFSAYIDNDVALNMNDRDDRDPHRTILDRCLVSLSSAVFVSERDKNALWEHMRVLSSEGVSPKLLAMLNSKDAVWSFKEPSLSSGIPPVVNNMGIVPNAASAAAGVSSLPMGSPNMSGSTNSSITAPSMHGTHIGGLGPHLHAHSNNNINNNNNSMAPPVQHLNSLSVDPYGSTAQKLDFSMVSMQEPDHLGSLELDSGLLGSSPLEPRF